MLLNRQQQSAMTRENGRRVNVQLISVPVDSELKLHCGFGLNLWELSSQQVSISFTPNLSGNIG